jgi:thioredoxin 1
MQHYEEGYNTMAEHTVEHRVGEVTDATWDHVVNGKENVQVVVDFWAPWCGPCRMVAPVLEQLAEEYEGRVKFVKLNTDENPQTSSQYGIRSIPTLAVFHNGEAINAMMGAGPIGHMRQFVDASLEKVSDGVAVH